jgi:DNA-binding MarR family transcriptional regulator
VAELSYEDSVAVLVRLGLTPVQARFYLHLLRQGPTRASELARAVSVHRVWGYRVLEEMQSHGLVEVLAERPRRYVATPLESFAERSLKERALSLETDRALLKLLVADREAAPSGRSVRFQIFRRLGPAQGRAALLLGRCERDAQVLWPAAGWRALRAAGVWEAALGAARAGRAVRMLVGVDPALRKDLRSALGEGLPPGLELRELHQQGSRLVLVDHREALVFLSSGEGSPRGVVAAWSNDPGFVDAHGVLFRSAWEASRPFRPAR